MKKKPTIRKLLKEGKTYNEIVEIVGCAKSTISYHAKKLGLAKEPISQKRYDWKKVQAYHDEGHGVLKTIKYFGMAKQTWQKAKERGDIVSRGYPEPMPLQELKSRSSVRDRIIRNNLISYKCSICGIFRWRGQELSLNLDHINGNGDDHRLENLRFICPNCDSQLPTYSGRNVKR